MLEIKNVSKTFDGREIFKNISFNVLKGEIFSITGANGCGKSTLLNGIMGNLFFDTGEVDKKEKITMSEYRNDFPDQNCVVMEYVMSFDEEMGKCFKIIYSDDFYEELGKNPYLADYIDTYSALEGYLIENKARDFLMGIGLKEHELSMKIKDLSEGQKKKVELARLEILDSDIIIMDEPTTHMDIKLIEFLENWMYQKRKYGKSFIVVSHDRFFVDRVADKTMNISGSECFVVNGGFTDLGNHIERVYDSRRKNHEEIEREIKKLENEVNRRKNWSEKIEKRKIGGKEGKSKDRKVKNRGYLGRKSKKLAKTAKVAQKKIEKQIENLKAVEIKKAGKMKMHFSNLDVDRKLFIRSENMSFSYDGNLLLENISLEILTDQRIAIIGCNGCGKTTFLRLIDSEINPCSGSLYKNSNVEYFYIPQKVESVFDEAILLDNFKGSDDGYTRARSLMISAKISREALESKINTLSRGELLKAAICLAIFRNSPFLILDEPTNHLDVEALNVLDDLLDLYSGGVLFVSHDRSFIARNSDTVFLLDKGVLKETTL